MDSAAPSAQDAWTDDELFAIVQRRRSVKGDPDRCAALEILFERYRARVQSHCRRLLGDADRADDATQDIFMSLLVRAVHYESTRHFGSWLYVVVRNHCLNVRRRLVKEAPIESIELWGTSSGSDDPNSRAEQHELAELVDRVCRAKLTMMEQQVVHLRYAWGLRVKEINSTLQLENVSGARSHLATAKRKLRTALQEQLGADEIRRLLGEE